MARRVAEEQDWDEDDDDGSDWEPEEDRELDEEELAELLNDDNETIPCPYCGEPIFEEAQRCPHCEEYISEEDSRSSRKPLWIIIGFILCFIIVALFTW